MVDRSEFLWMFPCYILATNFTRTSDGEPVFDGNIRFATPEIALWQAKAIAIFTDAHAARDFLECTTQQEKLELLEIPNIVRLKHFLEVAAPFYRHLTVDLNAKNRSSRMFLVVDVLRQIDHHLGRP